MSVQARIEDARLLWSRGRYEGAFLSALVAVAATARKRFPDGRTISDREAFERFLKSALSVHVSVEYLGECQPIEHIFYKWFRCELVHEGAIPTDIEIAPSQSLFLRAGGAPEFILKISEGWFHHLVNAVISAPENIGLK